MTISVVGVGNAAGESAGTTTTASTVSVTPTRHASTASGDRVFVVVGANNTAGATPANWTALFKDTAIASSLGAAGAGTGQRFLSVYYRDYDGVWTMPAFTLTSAAQNTQTLGSITLRKSAADTWNTPTASGVGNFAGTAGTAFTATTAAFGTTGSGVGQQFNLILACSVFNDNVTMTSETITGTNGFTSSTVTEQVDGGNATGNDVSLKLCTCPPAAGGEPAGTLTHAGTLSAASQGGFIAVQQTVSPVKAGTITDSYDAGFPGTIWTNIAGSGGVAEAGGVRVAHTVGPSNYQSYGSNFYDLTSSSAFIEIRDYGNQTLASHYVQFGLFSADNAAGGHGLVFLVQAGILAIYKIVLGAYTQFGSNITLSTSNHRWLRISESGGGTIFWDSSPDSLTWTNLASVATPFPIIAMQAVCECSVNSLEASASSALFDNFNSAADDNAFFALF